MKLKTQTVMKLQNSYCEKKTQNSKCDKVLKKTEIVTKLKNSNGDKTQIVTKF